MIEIIVGAIIIVLCIILIILSPRSEDIIFGALFIIVSIFMIMSGVNKIKDSKISPPKEDRYEQSIIYKKIGNKMVPVDTVYRKVYIFTKL